MPFRILVNLVRLPLGFAAAGPIDMVIHQDVINPEIKTAKSFEKFSEIDTETGIDRINKMFVLE
jgi:hypothetical protein